MIAGSRHALGVTMILMIAGLLVAQAQGTPKEQIKEQPKLDPPPARDAVAARVNGQVVPELAVYRSVMHLPEAKRLEMRKNVLNYLIDNTIVDQYLVQLKIQVDTKDVDEHVGKLKKEAADLKKDFTEELKKLVISEEELRTEMTAALRWDKFVLQQGTDKVLEEYFKNNTDMFNGAKMRARHILIPVVDGKKEAAQQKLAGIKKQIDDEVGTALAKLPGNTDPITREKERVAVTNKVFAEIATKESTCPTKKDGGDLDFFRRAGDMVEPFARAAFALKPNQMSEPVATDFGYHLILAIEHRPGKDVKFEQVKPFVQEVYGERLREAVVNAYKAKSKIEIVEKK